jgi:hypothetical protein
VRDSATRLAVVRSEALMLLIIAGLLLFVGLVVGAVALMVHVAVVAFKSRGKR